jgi:hypothetical protein
MWVFGVRIGVGFDGQCSRLYDRACRCRFLELELELGLMDNIHAFMIEPVDVGFWS